jgi:hypothetical protein
MREAVEVRTNKSVKRINVTYVQLGQNNQEYST